MFQFLLHSFGCFLIVLCYFAYKPIVCHFEYPAEAILLSDQPGPWRIRVKDSRERWALRWHTQCYLTRKETLCTGALVYNLHQFAYQKRCYNPLDVVQCTSTSMRSPKWLPLAHQVVRYKNSYRHFHSRFRRQRLKATLQSSKSQASFLATICFMSCSVVFCIERTHNPFCLHWVFARFTMDFDEAVSSRTQNPFGIESRAVLFSSNLLRGS